MTPRRRKAAPTPPDLTTALDLLGSATNTNLRVFVVHLDAGVPQAHEVILEVPPALQILKAVKSFAKKIGNRTLLPWGPVTLVEGGHCLYLQQQTCVLLQTTETTITTGNVDTFDPKASYAKNLRMLIAQVTLGNGITISAYRQLGRFMQFGQSGILTLLYREGRYNTIEPTDLLLFDLQFDVLAVDGNAFFEKKSTFEKMFDHMAAITAASKQTFTAVTTGLRIQGLADMEAACTTDRALMAKMASIARSLSTDPAYKKAMTMANLLSFVDSNPNYGIKTIGKGSKRSLVFEKIPSERHKIPKLLDDDYLYSTLTSRNYDTGSKTPT